MATECYTLVRGSAIRVTPLDERGRVPSSPFTFATTKCVSEVQIEEETTSTSTDLRRGEAGDGRLVIRGRTETTRFGVSVRFLETDPELLSMLTGVPVVRNSAGDIVGFDSLPLLPTTNFALEVWTRLTAASCEGGRRWGYTLFPHLRGGYLSGFAFENGLVSFTLAGAQTRLSPRWGRGPYVIDSEGDGLLAEPVGRGTNWRQQIVGLEPPAIVCGAQEGDAPDPEPVFDIVNGGSASFITDNIINNGNATSDFADVINGGSAA